MLKEKYSPMYFLSALGAGGLSVSFYIYLMFLVPHKGSPMATFDFVYAALLKQNAISAIALFALLGIVVFTVLHFKLLVWNIKQYKEYKKTDAFNALLNSNAEVTLMAIPLTLTMTINVCFVVGAVFVPGLWSVVEYLFPFALMGFMVAGYYAIKIFMQYFSRILTTGEFDFTKNNNLSQMISIFTFTMVAVGFAAPGAMSHHIEINSIGIFCAIFFASIAMLLILIKLVLGFNDMLKHGISAEASPSLWIMIPILTLLGITYVRVSFGLEHHFEQELAKASLFTFTSLVVSLQLIFGMIGYSVMKRINYFEEFIEGDKKSPVSFALICPGVAFMVFGMFFVNFGLTLNGIVAKYSIAYFIAMLPFVYIQFKTVVYFFKLKRKFSL
jgi:hypothetical protein